MENKCKEMSHKKKETDKTECFGNKRKQKKGVLQKFTRIQKNVKKVIDTENKETIKEQEKSKF